MVFESRSILVLADSAWFSLLGLIVLALLAWLTQAMKKRSRGDRGDEGAEETVLEIDMSELLEAARPVPPPPKVELASVVRARAQTAPVARRSVVTHEPGVAPAQPQLPISRMRSEVRGLATESPASLRRWVMALEILAPPVALRRVPGPARDWLGVP